MRSMTWHPEPKDAKVSKYLDQTNHAPYARIFAISAGIFCGFTFLILMGVF